VEWERGASTEGGRLLQRTSHTSLAVTCHEASTGLGQNHTQTESPTADLILCFIKEKELKAKKKTISYNIIE
jgi:hypothetical protein